MRAAILFAFLSIAVSSYGREWVDSTGKHRVQADFVAISEDGESLTLKKDDQSTVSLPLSRLRKQDQDYAKFLAAGGDELVSQLSDPKQSIRHAAAAKLIALGNLPEDSVKPVLAFIDKEIVEMVPVPPKNRKRLEKIELVGDETSLIRIKAKPTEFLGEEVIIVGVVSPSSYYNYGYDNAESTHFATDFSELSTDLTRLGRAHVYIPKVFSGLLVDGMAESVESGLDGKLVRMKVSLDPRRYEDAGTWDLLECSDWQLYGGEAQGWLPWSQDGLKLGVGCLQQLNRVAPVLSLLTRPNVQTSEAVDFVIRLLAAQSLKGIDIQRSDVDSIVDVIVASEALVNEEIDTSVRQACINAIAVSEKTVRRRAVDLLKMEYLRARRVDNAYGVNWSQRAVAALR
ncbi:hypothetical protein K227x_27420 [Rubripirellula lacrimiformis]|uniref:SLA1 homology domain-containing protein n=1 Tax=Rubripirellula lacrimiformis TaxID=1930273 RepID=A0A517NB38_9BACT|nr:SHD1 domain-containing protein [Rubripirellula lacrimiformis]QDT04351.1 hypothetical protein K227x_27420 [Rubripirellula lacrimiformis]